MMGIALFALFLTEKPVIAWSGFIAAFVCAALIVKDVDKPKAIDVYRGKTELKITFVGNEPVDSVVIYKRK